MRLSTNLLIPLFALLISTPSFGGRKKAHKTESNPNAPVVAVANLKVDSSNESVQKKIAELTNKVRDAVAESTTNCRVINTRQMKGLMRRHGKKLAKCYDDCDVELGLLIGANFVIGGHLAPTANSVAATLEIRDTRTRNVVASKRIEGGNYFELENALLSAVKRFVKPLNNVVYQAVDDEVIKDKPAEEPEPAQGADPFAPTTPQSDGTAPAAAESDYLAPPTGPVVQRPPTPLEMKWQEYKEEGPLLKDPDLGFQKAEAGIFGVGITVGYPINVSRAKTLTSLFTPVLHAGLQISARVHHMLEISILADFNYLTGKNSADTRFGDPGLSNCVFPDDNTEEDLRNCLQGSNIEFDTNYDDPSRNFYRRNTYGGGTYMAVGARPNIRLIFPLGNIVEVFVGAGLGMNYVHTSGWWETRAGGNQFVRPPSTETAAVTEHTIYDISVSSIGFYGAFEAAAVFRLLDKRLGVGPYVEYRLPAMWNSGTDADVKVQLSEYTILPGTEDDETRHAFRLPTEDDIRNSPFGHTEMLNLLTVGVTADWRF